MNLNEKPHVKRHQGQWVVMYVRAEAGSTAKGNEPRVRMVPCGNDMRRVQKNGRTVVNGISHYHRKIIARRTKCRANTKK